MTSIANNALEKIYSWMDANQVGTIEKRLDYLIKNPSESLDDYIDEIVDTSNEVTKGIIVIGHKPQYIIEQIYGITLAYRELHALEYILEEGDDMYSEYIESQGVSRKIYEQLNKQWSNMTIIISYLQAVASADNALNGLKT